MSEKKSPVERAINLFVYAPVGLLAIAREELPNIIEKGKQELTNQATVARMMGEYAVAEGRKEAGKRLDQASEVMGSLQRRTPVPPAPPASTTVASPPPPPAPPVPAVGSNGPAAAPPEPAPLVPPVERLAIPGYDALSASQVVQRLAGLSGSELDDVRAYESATRGRKTILNRVEQLRAGTGS